MGLATRRTVRRLKTPSKVKASLLGVTDVVSIAIDA